MVDWTGKAKRDRKNDERIKAVVGDGTWTGNRWEYKALTIQVNDEELMSALGDAGWELVSMVPTSLEGTSMWHAHTVWKRCASSP